ncbi:uncharacterized protein LOC130935290 isoform X2 [Arachis stenosperma]|uniref:uncharacterized protein LOC130935290 isoform X2 n=1 Tax=Arachis stenosperma TaxID=217475 RepID=UPI0025AB60BC|nr:uncharacterized protein LOC130935290 isoform X2 [Arachis stenosperma]
MKSAPSKGPLVGGTLTVIVTIEQDRKGRSDVMREEIRSATDALASVVEGVRRPRSIIRVVAVNYFSPALEKFQKCFCFHLATVIAIVDDIAAAEGHRRYCCGCCHKLGIKGTIALNSAIATSSDTGLKTQFEAASD